MSSTFASSKNVYFPKFSVFFLIICTKNPHFQAAQRAEKKSEEEQIVRNRGVTAAEAVKLVRAYI